MASAISFVLGTAESGMTHIEKKLKGFLEKIFIKTEKDVTIKIFYRDYPNIIIYETNTFKESDCLILRTQGINNKGERINYSSEKWYFDDTIIFEISGSRQTNVIFKVVLS